MSENKPMWGRPFYDKLHKSDCIIMACNTRIARGVIEGIFRAAKDTKSPIVFELAKSESDLKGGYTGLPPGKYAKFVNEAATKVQYPYYVIHADHIKIAKMEDIPGVKELISAQIEAGYTSFAIDASFMYDTAGSNDKEHLAKNIDATSEVAHFIEDKLGHRNFGLEAEVGEIGKKDPTTGLMKTTVNEASTYIEALKENDVDPQFLAIANGSVHGFQYDEHGNPIQQVGIDIELTKKIGAAIKPMGVKIAQHGITGTPLEMIASEFPLDVLGKGNVGTNWMTIAWDVLKIFEPELYGTIHDWTITNYQKENVPEKETFLKYSKLAIIKHFDDIYSIKEETEHALTYAAYASALFFFKAFNSYGQANQI
ncbi:MAG: class II fructose-bisphosphate aldolase [Candidatus Hodarchaeales archaeon]|jgi:fructose-bisphosphate aldolase class II